MGKRCARARTAEGSCSAGGRAADARLLASRAGTATALSGSAVHHHRGAALLEEPRPSGGLHSLSGIRVVRILNRHKNRLDCGHLVTLIASVVTGPAAVLVDSDMSARKRNPAASGHLNVS